MTMPADNTRRSRASGIKIGLAAVAATIVAIFLIGVGVGFMDAHRRETNTPTLAAVEPWLIIAIAAAVAVASFIVGMRWMQGIDELAQRAHYEAWYWGGSLGLMAMAFFVVAAPALDVVVDVPALVAPLAPFAGQSSQFVAGVMACMLTLCLGYGAWWLVFWLRKR